ncbi:hypothetical protein M405DRAFT_860797 [Rhizopogon salebrosus TDB-379]|nr:hypothetical protein M405DRAFT_860797 [Rhizopogon salebrosus TDB-379]
MPRKTTAAIDHEIDVLQAQIAILNRRGRDFVRILDDMARLRDSVKTESMALASQVTALQRQRNPINWLLSELLIQIFLSLAEDDSDSSSVLAYNPSPVIISHKVVRVLDKNQAVDYAAILSTKTSVMVNPQLTIS